MFVYHQELGKGALSWQISGASGVPGTITGRRRVVPVAVVVRCLGEVVFAVFEARSWRQRLKAVVGEDL